MFDVVVWLFVGWGIDVAWVSITVDLVEKCWGSDDVVLNRNDSYSSVLVSQQPCLYLLLHSSLF